ncbi:MAG: sodium:solute symporter family protein [Bacteroidia bacterium]|nr:sodium:solute symporter family protein [Bacteroidia bacterium]MDW8416702.1 sodium:solute symporter family protein [Bacteroidia bacterium]
MEWAVLGYVLFSISIGGWAARRVRNSQDFLVAGRRLPFLWAMSLLFSTWFGSETILGASEAMAHGGLLAVIEDPFGSALCLFLVGVWLARPFYRLPIRTFGDFYALYFGQWTERIATPLMIISYFGWIAAQLVAMAQVISHFSGLDHFYTIPIATGLILSYTVWGGMWSVAAVDLFQNVLIIVGLVVLIFFLPMGWEVKLSELPAGFLDFFPPRDSVAWLNYLAGWMIIGLGSLPQQDMYQRVVSARSERTATIAAVSASILYLTVGLLPLIGGLFVRIYHPEWLQDEAGTSPILRLVEGYMPRSIQVLFWGALVSAIMSSASGGILAPAALLSENILAKWQRFSPLGRARFSVLLVGLICMVMGIYERNVYELVAESSIFSLVTLFIPMVVALHLQRWRSSYGAILSMLMGVTGYYLMKIIGSALHPLWYGMLGAFMGYVSGMIVEKLQKVRDNAKHATP